MNILHMTDALPPAVLGGSGRIVWEISKGLAKRGHDVTVLTCAATGTFPAEKDGIRIVTIDPRPQRWAHYRSVFSMKRAREVMAHIIAIRPDVIHAHLMAGQIGYRWIALARATGIPVIVTCHDVMNVACGRVFPSDHAVWLKDLKRLRWSWNPLRTWMIRTMLMGHCTVLSVSDALRTWMEQFGYANLRTLHNGVDTHFWSPHDQHKARHDLGLPNDAPIFLLAGRLGIDKGIELIAATLPSDAHLLIAGTVDTHVFANIGDRAHLLGTLDETGMRSAYAACDVSLVPSRCLDCFPTVCLESMACARAVIATSWGGSKESVVDGKTGWIINPLDEHTWRARLEWCTSHRSDLQKMGVGGRTHVEEYFSLQRMLDRLMAEYATLLS